MVYTSCITQCKLWCDFRNGKVEKACSDRCTLTLCINADRAIPRNVKLIRSADRTRRYYTSAETVRGRSRPPSSIRGTLVGSSAADGSSCIIHNPKKTISHCVISTGEDYLYPSQLYTLRIHRGRATLCALFS